MTTKTASLEGGARLRARRMDLGLTVPEVARRLKVNRATVYSWEAGTTEPKATLRPQIARLYKVDMFSVLYNGAAA